MTKTWFFVILDSRRWVQPISSNQHLSNIDNFWETWELNPGQLSPEASMLSMLSIMLSCPPPKRLIVGSVVLLSQQRQKLLACQGQPTIYLDEIPEQTSSKGVI